MNADRERAEALRQEWRHRLDSLLVDLLPPEERLEEYQREVVQERVADTLATQYGEASEKPRSRRTRLYGWFKRMRGR